MAERAPLIPGPGAAITTWVESVPGEAGIGPTEVHVWRFPLGDPGSSYAIGHLTDDERTRAENMTSQAARQAYVASQSALREVLSGYTRTLPQEVEIVRAPRGKPMLASSSRKVEFNVSHSGDWGVVAIAHTEVGVDVEQVRPRRTSTRLADRFMTAGERELLRLRAESQGDAAFFVVWSRKEAYLKAVGFGLSGPFSHVDSSGSRLPDLDEHGHQLAGDTPWAVEEFFVDDRHPATVVARAERLALRPFTLRRSDV